MNQILVTENKKKKRDRLSSAPVEIRNIIIFFALAIIIYSVFLIGQATSAMYREAIGNNKENLPQITITRINDTAIIKVTSIEIITNLKYSWNNAEETVIPVETTSVEEEIFLPNENSILNIVVEDVNGRAVKYQKEFFVEGLDITKPSIEITQEQTQGNIKITATDEIMIEHMIYQINGGDEIRVDRSEAEEKTINYIIELERGENKLKVTAVDTSGNVEEIEKTIIVSELPTIELEQKANKLIVTIKDTDGIEAVKANLNGVIYAGKDIKKKEIRLGFDLREGTNTIKITVTNVNGLVAEGVRELNYAQ